MIYPFLPNVFSIKIARHLFLFKDRFVTKCEARFYAKFQRCGPCFCIKQEKRRVQILIPDSRSVPPIQRVPSPLAWRTIVSTLTAPILPTFLRGSG